MYFKYPFCFVDNTNKIVIDEVLFKTYINIINKVFFRFVRIRKFNATGFA